MREVYEGWAGGRESGRLDSGMVDSMHIFLWSIHMSTRVPLRIKVSGKKYMAKVRTGQMKKFSQGRKQVYTPKVKNK